jgi:hypothetical protein
MKDLLTWETTDLSEDETTIEMPIPGTPVVPIELTAEGRPDPQWVRGRCPECGDDLVSILEYTGGKGYLLVWECWGSRGENPCCHYRRVL